MTKDEFGIKDDDEAVECAMKIIRGIKKINLGNENLLDKSFKEEFDDKPFNYGKFLYAVCKTGQGERYYKMVNKFMERVTEEAKVLNRELKEEDLKRIFDNVMNSEEFIIGNIKKEEM